MNKEQAYEELRVRIVTNDVAPGEILNEKDLMAQLAIGRSPLREILFRLQEENMIKPLPRLGYMVTNLTIAEVRDLVELRRELEGYAGYLAAQRITADQLEDLRLIKVSVNVSIRELNEPRFADNVIQILEETGLSPDKLSIEVTESLFMVNYNENVRKLQRLKDIGVLLSIDDFGKGYSSMSYLRRLPVDRLKIDKEFVDHITTDKKSEEIVRGITLMAQSLNMRVCAEGVETIEQCRMLREIGVDQIQGFLTGYPVSVEKFVELIENE